MKHILYTLCTLFLVTTLASCDKDNSEDRSLVVTPATLNFVGAGETKTLEVKAQGVVWVATTEATWLTLTDAEGVADGVITVTATASQTTEVHEAVITLSVSGMDPVEIPVTQEGARFVKADFYGVYVAEYDKWDLEAKSTFYPILENGDFDYDNTVTALQYCEKYVTDYNADRKPEIPFVAEDRAYNWYNENYNMRFELTEDTFQMIRFAMVVGGNGLNLYDIVGTYEYDAEKGEFLVHDVAVEDDPRDLRIRVSSFTKGEALDVVVKDLYWWCATTYDDTIKYLPSVTTTYVTKIKE